MNLVEGTHRKPPVIERAALVKTDGRSDAIRSVETCDGLARIVEPEVTLVIWERSLPLSFGNGLKNWRRGNCRTCAF